MPIGFMSAEVFKRKSLGKCLTLSTIGGLIFSLLIELCQYWFYLGTAEVDDLLDNTFGTILGVACWFVLHARKLLDKSGKSKHKFSRTLTKILSIIFVVISFIACIVPNLDIERHEETFAFQLDKVSIEESKLSLTGFCFPYGFELTDSEQKDINLRWDDEKYTIVLKSVDDGSIHTTNMTRNINNKEIEEYFRCKHKYEKVGFNAQIDVNEIDLDLEYEVLVQSGKLFLPTKTYIKGDLILQSTEEKSPKLDIAGTDLQKIVNDGYLRLYRKDKHCAIYQYEGKLFFIADKQFEFDKNGTTIISCLVHSTQLDKALETEFTKRYHVVDITTNFEKHELTNTMNCGKYRVSAIELPTEYSIASIEIGSFNKHWVWKERFRTHYPI